MSWRQRMLEGRRAFCANVNSADRANRTGDQPSDQATGAIGTIGTGSAVDAAEPIGTTGAIGHGTDASAGVAIGAIGTNGSGTAALAADAGDVISAYHERLAVCLEGGDVSEDEAHRLASTEARADLDTLADQQARAWQAKVDAWQAADASLARLRLNLLELAHQPWLVDAARNGWTDVALFGAHPVAPFVRVECWGLCTALALSPFNLRARRVRLAAIDAARAQIETPTGVRFSIEPSAAVFDHAVPAWSLSSAPREAGLRGEIRRAWPLITRARGHER